VIHQRYASKSWTFGGFSGDQFKGAYGYGTPRVGNLTFAEYTQFKRLKVKFPFFRVIGATDIVCRMPMGRTASKSGMDPESKEDASDAFLFDCYAHFGTPVCLHSGIGETITRCDTDPTQPEIVWEFLNYFMNLTWIFGRSGENLIGYGRRLCNPFVNMLDHFPSEYYWRIGEARRENSLARIVWKQITTSAIRTRQLMWAPFNSMSTIWSVVLRTATAAKK